MVERGKLPRHMVGIVIGGGGCSDQTQVGGDRGQRREQGEWIERGDRRAAFEGRHWHIEHGQVVGHEKGIEAATFQGTHKALVVRKIEVGIRKGPRIAPGRSMNADRSHERAEPQLS